MVEGDGPFADPGTRFAIVRNGRSGVFLQITDGKLEERSGIEYDPASSALRLAEPLGGAWSIRFLSDIANALNTGPFTRLEGFTREELTALAARRGCDIAYVKLDLYEHFYEQVDPWTGATVDDARVPLRRLDGAILARLKAWRNAYGVPWSTVVYSSDLTLGDVHNHSVRLGIASLLTTDDSWRELERVLRQAAQAEGQTLQEWATRHVSQFASLDGRFLYWACFAWYTGPQYVAGRLPRQAELLLEKMARLEHLAGAERVGFWEEDVPIAARLPTLRVSLERARRKAPAATMEDALPIAGFDVRYFLDRAKLEARRRAR